MVRQVAKGSGKAWSLTTRGLTSFYRIVQLCTTLVSKVIFWQCGCRSASHQTFITAPMSALGSERRKKRHRPFLFPLKTLAQNLQRSPNQHSEQKHFPKWHTNPSGQTDLVTWPPNPKRKAGRSRLYFGGVCAQVKFRQPLKCVK